MNKEHIFPKWLLNRTNTRKDLFESPYGRIPGDQFTVPLCEECNSQLGRDLELPVSKIFESIESGTGFNDYDAELLFRWMWKMTGLAYWSICSNNWKYSLISLKERVLSRITPPRDRLSIAVSLIKDPYEDYGCSPVGLDVLPLLSNVYAAGVFSRISIVVFYSEYRYFFEKLGWTVYRLSSCPNVLNPENRIIPTTRFKTGGEAITFVKKIFGDDADIYYAHEALALMQIRRIESYMDSVLQSQKQHTCDKTKND